MSNFPEGYSQLFHSISKLAVPQIITAYVCLYILVPKFLDTKKMVSFVVSFVVLLIIMYAFYLMINNFIYEPRYYDTYTELQKKYAAPTYFEDLTDVSYFLNKAIKFITPTALLLMFRFYKNQQKYLKLNEQKKTAELTALKHQLNPHFLFNTLNNLYALAIKKSDQTPDVIEKLSEILDYMLYRTSDTFVSLQKEIELIENYLSLEKIRYGKRVDISFKKDIESDVKIAPLLLLTFIENAFKHGVTQELDKAKILIRITTKNNRVLFNIKNSKPKSVSENKDEPCIGLDNVKKQLELLYPNQYELIVDDSNDFYAVTLNLKAK